MSKTLIIAEKPSVAREIAKVLGLRPSRADGHIADAEYVVTWAIGHLVNIAEPEEQDPAWAGRWSMKQLPMIPLRFKLGILPGTQKQFSIVKGLMGRDDVDLVINATDAGREGELIFRRIAVMAECTKPVRRLWANDMTEQGLKKALAKTVPDEEKRNLGLASFARAEADWLIGMNFSRLFTLKDHSLITVGRVQTPVLKLIVDRRREIELFTSKDYWTVEALLAKDEETFTAIWHAPPEYSETRIDSESDAQVVFDACTGKDGKVESVKSASRQQKPPLPFDLTTLQREANSHHGFSAKDTLTIAQALYEQKKLITYPRTDSRYLTRELFKEALGHLRATYKVFPEISAIAAERIKNGKHRFECVNDKKVSDHHAIIPTAKPPNRDALSGDEWKIYEMVARRFCAAFMPAAKFSASTVWAVIEEHKFKATGKVFKDRGWLAAEPWRTAADNPLPNLRKGSEVKAMDLSSKKHQTKPSAHFTDASLLAAMETAGKLVDDEELREAMKERGLGTPATRAQIIETLLARKYVEKDKKKLIATDLGCHAVDMIESFLPQLVSPQMTGDWEKRLKDIEQGQDTYPAFMQDIRTSVMDGVQLVRNHRAFDANGFPMPLPGQEPTRSKTAAAHAGQAAPQPRRPGTPRYDRDGFPITDAPPRANNPQGAARQSPAADGPAPSAPRQAKPAPGNSTHGPKGNLPAATATGTATPGGTARGRHSAGNPASPPQSTAPPLDRDGFPVESAPAPKKLSGETLGPCPLCAKDVFEQPGAFECAGLDDGSCTLRIQKNLFGGEVREAMVRDLLSTGRTYKRARFESKAGKKFNAFLKLDPKGQVELLFE
ncbi:MAG: DNA topoisomerase 3 [Proteobacteria bacterium]|nr:DNA topoisomerase 3 [Pseudomonadota bacterium]